jgi:methylenetetrahydrofolate reductase (NADPH)
MPIQALERTDLDDRSLRRRMAELVVNGSIEVIPREAHRAAEIAGLLPAGTAAYVPALPGQPLAPMLDTLRALHAAGFDPVPHVAARRMPSRDALRDFLERAVGECGVHRVLLLGGDLEAPAGPYADAAAVLRDDVLRTCGVREAGFAGYPEGHPRIDAAHLESALHEKFRLAREQGLGTSVVTQFAFAPARIAAYCASLARSAPDVPVYVGLAGPANPVTLLRYAQRCGVAASLRALQNLGTQAARLIGHLDPEDLLHGMANYCGARPACNVVGVHLYSFGGVVPTAQWMRRIIAG